MKYHKRHTLYKRFIHNVSIICLLAMGASNVAVHAQDTCDTQPCESDLVSDSLAASWDEGMPLGNATVGALVWRKDNALCQAEWPDGTTMQTFVHATEPVGWFVFRNLRTRLVPQMKTPVYKTEREPGVESPVSGQSMERLGKGERTTAPGQ